MALLDRVPVPEIAKVGINSDDGSDDEEDSCDINEEEHDSMQQSRNFSEEDGYAGSEEPEES